MLRVSEAQLIFGRRSDEQGQFRRRSVSLRGRTGAKGFVGAATGDKASEVKGAYNDVAGSAQSAWGSAKDAAKEMADSGHVRFPICLVCVKTSQN